MAKIGRRRATTISRKKYSKFEPVLYGLEGIMTLFNVSKTTAHRYKEGFLKPAVTQQGKKIIVDTKMALKLFGVSNVNNLVKAKKTVKGLDIN